MFKVYLLHPNSSKENNLIPTIQKNEKIRPIASSTNMGLRVPSLLICYDNKQGKKGKVRIFRPLSDPRSVWSGWPLREELVAGGEKRSISNERAE